MKLTPVQRHYLKEISNAGVRGIPVYAEYPPARKLVELGLARWQHRPLSNPLCIITDEGREVVAGWSEE